MRINLSSYGLYVVFRYSSRDRDGLGFVLKPQKHMYFSERYDGYLHGYRLPFGLYFRTFKRRP